MQNIHSAGLRFTPCFNIDIYESSTKHAYDTTKNLFSLTTKASLCWLQKSMRVLRKSDLRSAKWKSVIEQLDSVNVFIFPVLKFKKWNQSLPPGCTLSCLKEAITCSGCVEEALGFWSSINHKTAKGAIHQNLRFLLVMNNYTKNTTKYLIPPNNQL